MLLRQLGFDAGSDAVSGSTDVYFRGNQLVMAASSKDLKLDGVIESRAQRSLTVPLFVQCDIRRGRARDTSINVNKIGATGRKMDDEVVWVGTRGTRKH